jgi:hypothetical protein
MSANIMGAGGPTCAALVEASKHKAIRPGAGGHLKAHTARLQIPITKRKARSPGMGVIAGTRVE